MLNFPEGTFRDLALESYSYRVCPQDTLTEAYLRLASFTTSAIWYVFKAEVSHFQDILQFVSTARLNYVLPEGALLSKLETVAVDFRNRLIAFEDEHSTLGSSALEELLQELDRLTQEFSELRAQVHPLFLPVQEHFHRTVWLPNEERENVALDYPDEVTPMIPASVKLAMEARDRLLVKLNEAAVIDYLGAITAVANEPSYEKCLIECYKFSQFKIATAQEILELSDQLLVDVLWGLRTAHSEGVSDG